MHIIPSFLVDKASCTRQFESQLSLHSLASLFPIKEGIFLPLRLSCKERLFSKTYPSFLTLKEGSTSHLGLLPSGKKKETALLGARNRYAIRLTGHQSPRQIVRDGTAGGQLAITCWLRPPFLFLIAVSLCACRHSNEEYYFYSTFDRITSGEVPIRVMAE
jgi:hypothetical protein